VAPHLSSPRWEEGNGKDKSDLKNSFRILINESSFK